MVLKEEFKLKKGCEATKAAIELKDFLKGYINYTTFSMADDLLKREGSLFKLEKDVFHNSPLKAHFKWVNRKSKKRA